MPPTCGEGANGVSPTCGEGANGVSPTCESGAKPPAKGVRRVCERGAKGVQTVCEGGAKALWSPARAFDATGAAFPLAQRRASPAIRGPWRSPSLSTRSRGVPPCPSTRIAGDPQLPHRRRVPGLRGDLSGDFRRATASRPARRRDRPTPRVAAGACSRRTAPQSPTRERRSPPGHGLRPGASRRTAPRYPTGCSCRTAGASRAFEATSAAISDRATASRPARRRDRPAPRVAAGACSRRPEPRYPTR